MTSRMDLLKLICDALTQHLGSGKVTRRADGVIVVAGRSEAFLVQALLVDAPEGTDALTFGEGLVNFIQTESSVGSEVPTEATASDSDGEVFYTSKTATAGFW